MKTIKLFVQAEGNERIELIELPQIASVKDILLSAQSKGISVLSDGVLLFDEDNEDPIDSTLSLEMAGIKDRAKIHIHRCRKIDIVIHFKAEEVQKSFPPSATVAKVQKWAAHKFLPNEVDRTEHELQICETDTRPSPNTQIGALVRDGNCTLCFDLVPTERIEG